MKFAVRNLLLSLSVIALALFVVPSAHAQKNDPPSGKFGIGAYVASGIPGIPVPSGLSGTYAINSDMQVGSYLSLAVASSDGASATTFLLAPYFRYLFNSTASPYVQGGFSVITGGGSTTAGIFLGGGLSYYMSEHFGVHTDVDIIDVEFSPSSVVFGWANLRAGMMWFF